MPGRWCAASCRFGTSCLLKERKGIDKITIGEGMVTMDRKDRETPAHAFATLGYNALKKRYGVRSINVLYPNTGC